MNEPHETPLPTGITPKTRRTILVLLGAIAALCIVAETALLVVGVTTSEALLTIAATAVGGLAGMAVPPSED